VQDCHLVPRSLQPVSRVGIDPHRLVPQRFPLFAPQTAQNVSLNASSRWPFSPALLRSPRPSASPPGPSGHRLRQIPARPPASPPAALPGPAPGGSPTSCSITFSSPGVYSPA
jgi:hypothetical protein